MAKGRSWMKKVKDGHKEVYVYSPIPLELKESLRRATLVALPTVRGFLGRWQERDICSSYVQQLECKN